MKKLITSICLLVLIGISANVMGQTSTATFPGVGDIYSYSVASHPGSTYTWTLTTSANVGGTDILGGIVTAAGGVNSSTITLTWVNPLLTQIYYLHVSETASNGCTNMKVKAIEPKNYFKLEVYNVNSDGSLKTGTESTTYTTCPPAISAIEWNGGAGPVTDINTTDFKYEYGTLEFYYKVTASGINFTNTSWTPNVTVTQVQGALASVTYAVQTTTSLGTWGSDSPMSTSQVINPTISNNSVLWIKVIVKNNNNTEALANENTTASDFAVTINPTSVDQQNHTALITNGLATQTQSKRPATGFITTP